MVPQVYSSLKPRFSLHSRSLHCCCCCCCTNRRLFSQLTRQWLLLRRSAGGSFQSLATSRSYSSQHELLATFQRPLSVVSGSGAKCDSYDIRHGDLAISANWTSPVVMHTAIDGQSSQFQDYETTKLPRSLLLVNLSQKNTLFHLFFLLFFFSSSLPLFFFFSFFLSPYCSTTSTKKKGCRASASCWWELLA